MKSAILVTAGVLCLARPATAAEPVDVALVLVDDVSGSINDEEYKLEKDGYFDAFTNDKVIGAMKAGPIGAIAVCFVEFAGAGQVHTVIDWTVLRDAGSAHDFAQKIRDAPRSGWGHTAIGDGLTLALQNLARGGTQASRLVVDIAGDGIVNEGRPVEEARNEAARQGVTVNALAIANESKVPWLQAHTHPPGGLANYYRQNVTTGEASFVLEVHDYKSFRDTVMRKLIEEIAAAQTRPVPEEG